jgi:hypothetical protein
MSVRARTCLAVSGTGVGLRDQDASTGPCGIVMRPSTLVRSPRMRHETVLADLGLRRDAEDAERQRGRSQARSAQYE